MKDFHTLKMFAQLIPYSFCLSNKGEANKRSQKTVIIKGSSTLRRFFLFLISFIPDNQYGDKLVKKTVILNRSELHYILFVHDSLILPRRHQNQHCSEESYTQILLHRHVPSEVQSTHCRGRLFFPGQMHLL